MNEKDKLDLITRRTIGAGIDQLAPIHDAQLLSYLRMSGMRVRLLLNFHVRILKDGIRRIVNEFPDSLLRRPVDINKRRPVA